MIFAAGYGKRMAPLTDHMPKPLIRVCGKPLIVYHIENLTSLGVTRIVINSHWQADKLVAALGDGERFGVHILWSHEPQILNTGGGMLHALPMLGSEPFLVVNGDVWTDYDFSRLVAIEVEADAAHLVMVPNPPQHHQGDFAVDSQGRLSLDDDAPRLTYSGIGLYGAQFIRRFAPSTTAFPLVEALQAAVACGKVTAELYEGDWEDVGTPDRFRQLEDRLTAPGGRRGEQCRLPGSIQHRNIP